MAGVDISEGARELVDLNAEAVGTLGEHLKQIGVIIASSTQPPKRDAPRSTARKVLDKLDLYKDYCDDVVRRRREIEKKTEEDFERLAKWRSECGAEGSSLVEQMEGLYDKVRMQRQQIELTEKKLEEERMKVVNLKGVIRRKDSKLEDLAEVVVENKKKLRTDRSERAAVSSWIQCTIDNIKFKFKADQERERLRIEHHKRLRKAACERGLKFFVRQRELAWLQKCTFAMQEEVIEGRAFRHLEEMRRRYEDHVLVLQAQLSQALGDEEKSKALVAEQVRRLEEERRKARDAEKAMRDAIKETRAAKEETRIANIKREEALAERDAANTAREQAEADAAAARAEAAEANARAEAFKEAMIRAEQQSRELEDAIRKKNKKIKTLQKMLEELGAESDSDAPPDERPPPFFVNEAGTKVPRPRTRKERMGMAYREAESARWELRIGMAAVVDKEVERKASMEKLLDTLEISRREVNEVRLASQILQADLIHTRAVHVDARSCTVCRQCVASTDDESSQSTKPPQQRPYSVGGVQIHAPLLGPPFAPLAPSKAAVPLWSPTRPTFQVVADAPENSTSPRLITKTASQPVLMPPLVWLAPDIVQTQRLAPLRKLRRTPADWHAGWH